MEPPTVTRLALMVAVVLAGCGGSQPSRETPTITSAPLPPVEQGERQPTPVAPGVSVNGTLRPAELVAAHASRLENTSYSIRTNRTVREEGRLVSASETRLDIGADRQRYRYASEFVRYSAAGRQAERTRIELFTDGDQTYQRLIRNRTDGENSSVVRRVESSAVLPFELTYDRALFSLFADSEVTAIERRTVGGGTAYAIRHEMNQVEVYSFADEATLSTLVRDDGLVQRYRVDYTVSVDDPTRRVAWTVRFTDLGSTRVVVPPWVPASTETVTSG